MWRIEIRTPIPEAGSYGLAILLVYGLSSYSLAGELHQRWLARRGVRPVPVYCGVLAFVVAWGALLLDVRGLAGDDPIGWLAALPAGVAAGAIAGWADRAILRGHARRLLRRGRSPAVRSDRGIGRPSFRRDEFPLWAAIAVAALEELVYRGMLVRASLLVDPGGLAALALVGTVVAFGLSHVWFGWAQVRAKLPLGALALAVTLATGTVLAAIVAHVVFNVRVWRAIRASEA